MHADRSVKTCKPARGKICDIPPLDCARELAIKEVFPKDKAWDRAVALAAPTDAGGGGDLEWVVVVDVAWARAFNKNDKSTV